ncbi:methyltransferase domain-containing protein [Planotetraspora kaengkrachanensis]|nr:methyltransferase domain-containing protein [Planotetraspora kaengkrachanensis]
MSWKTHAARLADRVTHQGSRWCAAIADTPRHFVPSWWTWSDDRWELSNRPGDERWLETIYQDRTLVTRVGALHADQAAPGDHPEGWPTSSSTLPGLLLQMYRHARIGDGHTILDVGTGSGYGTALLCNRVGDDRVTSVDVDPYLTAAAGDRLAKTGLKPRLATVDATGPLPDGFDRIVATVSVRPIPASWLEALRVGGRFATTIIDTSLILTGRKTQEGGAVGQIERDWAMFMRTRDGEDYPPGLADLMETARTADGDTVDRARFPILDLLQTWDVRSMLEITVPGIEHHYSEEPGSRTALMVHEDGSWARAVSTHGPPMVHQGGPRRLWDLLDEVRLLAPARSTSPVRCRCTRDPRGGDSSPAWSVEGHNHLRAACGVHYRTAGPVTARPSWVLCASPCRSIRCLIA